MLLRRQIQHLHGQQRVVQSELELTGASRGATGNVADNYLQQNISSWQSGHIYYYFMYATSTSQQTISFDVTNREGTGNAFISKPSVWTRGSSYFKATFSGDNNISVNFNKTTGTSYVDDICIIDLTAAFGSGNEPNQAWCNQNIDYFNGSKTVYK